MRQPNVCVSEATTVGEGVGDGWTQYRHCGREQGAVPRSVRAENNTYAITALAHRDIFQHQVQPGLAAR